MPAVLADSTDLTVLLCSAASGDAAAVERLYPLVYDDLRVRAARQRRALVGGATLNTTALVHESYFKLIGSPPSANDRAHFLAIASRAMRQVLVSYAERQHALKRGGAEPDVELDDAGPVAASVPLPAADLLSVHRALGELEAAVGARPARIVECRFFAGLTVEETAQALGVSEPTVKRGWRAARAWLYRRLEADFLSG